MFGRRRMGSIRNPLTVAERGLLKRWQDAGQHERICRYVERRLAIRPALFVLRFGIASAKVLEDDSRRERFVAMAVSRYPRNSVGYIERAQLHVERGDLDAARAALVRAPERRAVTRARTSVRVQGVAALRRAGLDHEALLELFSLQRELPGDHSICFRIADVYRDDGKLDRAHTYFRLAEALHPRFGAVRRLAFETDSQMQEHGRDTLSMILDRPAEDLVRYLPNLNRVSVLYPEHRARMTRVRDEARRQLRTAEHRDAASLSASIDTAMACRWIEDARKLLSGGERRGLTVAPSTRRWFARVTSDLGPLAHLVELADRNEDAETLEGLERGVRRRLTEVDRSADRVVELFLPTPFFARQPDQKPTYETVRRMFRALGETVLGRDDLVIVPRLQLNWRHCVPRAGARVISYHTRSPETDVRWLHVQESPLAGYCSIDPRGFAGFSSIARDHAAIDASTSHVSSEDLRRNHAEMYRHFVEGNVSKYAQSATNVPIDGRYVFVALQIPTDTVARLAWLDGLELLSIVSEHHASTGTRVVAKRHPYCGSMTVQKTLDEWEAAGRIVTSRNSIHDLISHAEVVFTVNSGVGLEALLHRKPVVTTGMSDYSYAAHEARSSDELKRVLSEGVVADEDRTMRFLHYYRHSYLVDVEARDAIAARIGDWLASSPSVEEGRPATRELGNER